MPDDRRTSTRLEMWRAELATQPSLRAQVDAWLKENPMPENFLEDADAWAFLEMPVLFSGVPRPPQIPWLRGAT